MISKGEPRNTQTIDKRVIRELEAENARLRAELEALKPRPVVKAVTYYADHHEAYPEILESDIVDAPDNLKLTFTDGKVVAVLEQIGDGK